MGVSIGVLPTGPTNSITDVAGVQVGHHSVVKGKSIRTGVTAIIPHQGNVFLEKTPAAFHVANGFGKFVGGTQVQELGFTLADGMEYARTAQQAGLDIDVFAGRLSFFFCIGMNFFMEVAKLRAARILWARIMKQLGAKKPRSMMSGAFDVFRPRSF